MDYCSANLIWRAMAEERNNVPRSIIKQIANGTLDKASLTPRQLDRIRKVKVSYVLPELPADILEFALKFESIDEQEWNFQPRYHGRRRSIHDFNCNIKSAMDVIEDVGECRDVIIPASSTRDSDIISEDMDTTYIILSTYIDISVQDTESSDDVLLAECATSHKGSYSQVVRSVELYMDCQNSFEEAKRVMSLSAFIVVSEKLNISNKYAFENLLPDCFAEYRMVVSTIEDELDLYLSNSWDDSESCEWENGMDYDGESDEVSEWDTCSETSIETGHMLPPKYHTNNVTQNTEFIKIVEPILYTNSTEDMNTTCDNTTAELTHTPLCNIIPTHAPFIPISHTLGLCKENPFSSDKSTSTQFTISPTPTHTPFIFGMNPIVIPP